MTPRAYFSKQRRAKAARPPVPLTVEQVRWLGSLLLATQLAMLAYVPLWIACLGTSLVAVRFVLIARAVRNPGTRIPAIRSWMLGLLAIVTAILIRQSLGYFIGRDPCVAFLFALTGIKFLETNVERDGTTIACLACLLIVTPFFYSQSLLAAAAAIPAVLLLGGALKVLARPTGMAPVPGGWRTPLGATAKMFAQGLPVAVLLFVLFPRISGPLWGVPADHSAKTGLSDHMEPGAISELSLSDAVAFRVDFSGPVPPPWLRYWRGPVLSSFDGRGWTMLPQRAKGAFVGSDGAPVVYTVTLEPHWKPWLFALDLPGGLPQFAGDADDGETRSESEAILSRDQQLLSRGPVTQPLRYRQASILADSYPAGGDSDSSRQAMENVQLPSEKLGFNPRAKAFALSLRQKHRDDEAYANAILDWLHKEPFFYTLTPPLLGRNSVDELLFDTRRGFCEHYASAFVVLLREAGIPARVVTGYQGGIINPNGEYMIVRQSDAHAWAEALIRGQWRRFDPTAAIAPSRILTGLGGAVPASDPIPMLARLDETFLMSLQLSWDAVNHDWRRNVIGFNFDRQRTLWREWKLTTLAPWQMTGIVLIVAAIWVGLLLTWLAWRRRRQDRARTLWDAMCKRLARAGLPREAHEGPIAYAARAAERWPRFSRAFDAIGDSYATLRYGPVAAQGDSTQERASALGRLRRSLALLPSPAELRARGAADA